MAVLLWAATVWCPAEAVFADTQFQAASAQGEAAIKRGDYAAAYEAYERALETASRAFGPEDLRTAGVLHILGAICYEMGQYAKAEPLSQLALKIRESKLGADHPDVATSLNLLATLYDAVGQRAEAESLYQRALKILESKLGTDHPDVAGILNNLAGLYAAKGEIAKTESLYVRALKILESKLEADHPDVASGLNNLAALYHCMGQPAKAEPLCLRALKIRESKLGADHPDVATSLNTLAGVHTATGRKSEANAETERARRIIRRYMARNLSALSEEEQLAFLQAQDAKSLHMALSRGLPDMFHPIDPQFVTQSAGWLLNGKAVAQEALAQRALLASQADDPALADLAKQLRDVRQRLAALTMTLPKAGQEADYRRELATLSQQEQELSRKLGQASGRNATGDPWVETAAVRKALPKDAVLLEIACFSPIAYLPLETGPVAMLLPPTYYAWVIPAEGQGDISIVELAGGVAMIGEAMQAARKALEQSQQTIAAVGEREAEQQLRQTLQPLSELLFAPLEEHLGKARQVIISPDAALWLVPWASLLCADGRYAIEKYQIRYVVSGRDLVTRATGAGPRATDPILFANPDFDLGPAAAAVATRAVLRNAAPLEQVASSRGANSLASLAQVARLPGTAEEVSAIKPSVTRYAGAEPTVYEDQYALEAVFKAVHRPKVLVLSTHGFFMPDQEVPASNDLTANLTQRGVRRRAVLTAEGKPLENPLLRCGLLLAGCNRRAETSPADDGILTGLEIVGTDLRGTDLVVLSACDTGLGQVRNGEGVAGLRQAFLLAGAKAVVSTLWQIPDQETAELMKGFFANLSAGQGKGQALHNAQLAQIKARRDALSAAHPYYWAAFTLTGE